MESSDISYFEWEDGSSFKESQEKFFHRVLNKVPTEKNESDDVEISGSLSDKLYEWMKLTQQTSLLIQKKRKLIAVIFAETKLLLNDLALR